MIEDTVKIVNEAKKDKIQVNLIINNRAGGNGLLIAHKSVEPPFGKAVEVVLISFWPIKAKTWIIGIL